LAEHLEIRLLGGLEFTHNGQPLTGFRSGKVAALLAWLAMNPRIHQRESLAGLFWGELSQSDATNNLRQSLSNLRGLVDDHLEITRQTVAFRTDAPHRLDAQAFAAALDGGRSLAPEQRITCLRQAVELYRGDFLDGVLLRDAPEFEEWMLAQRARYRESALQAMHELVDLLMAAGDYPAAIHTAARLLALDSWREEAHRTLMLALARTGQSSAALAQYENCRQILHEVFGAEPAAETTELYERIRAARRGRRHNLPPASEPLVGREAELAEIRRRLADPSCRLLTLVGAGGVGKSRLALAGAETIGSSFLNGVWYAPLAAVNPQQDDAIPLALAESLQLPLSGPVAAGQQVSDFLRHKELLLVLDNLDHLIDQAAWLSRLLQNAPDVKILATSRQRLNLRAEWLLDIYGLPYPSHDEAGAGDFPAVELFVRQAQRLRHNFATDAAAQAAITRICRLVDGVPLALEMAAAWVRALSPAQIVAEIEKSLDFLTDPRSDAVDHHRSQRAVFDASWKLLDPTERDAFARLAVFRGGFDSQAAEWVAGCAGATLAGLVDKSLIRREGEEHYSVHPLLQQYAREVLAAWPEQEQATIDRHVEWCTRLLAERQPDIYGAGLPAALAVINRNLDNIRQAWRMAAQRGHFGFFAQAVDALLLIFDIDSLSQEARQLLREARQQLQTHAAGQPEQEIVLAQMLAHEGVFSFRLGQFEQAKDYPRQAIGVLLRHHAPPFTLGHVYVFLGAAYFGLGDYDASIAAFDAARDAYSRAGSQWGVATALGNRAEVHMALQQMDAARTYTTQAYATGRESANAYLQSHNAYRMATVSAHFGEYEAARRYHQESLALAESLNYRGGMANAYAALGDIALAEGNYAEAEAQFDEARAINGEIGNWLDSAACQIQAGDAALAGQAWGRAATHLRQGLAQAAEIGADGVLAEGLLAWARLLIAQGEPGRAGPVLGFVAGDGESSPSAQAAAQALLGQQPGNAKAKERPVPSRGELLAEILGYLPKREA